MHLLLQVIASVLLGSVPPPPSSHAVSAVDGSVTVTVGANGIEIVAVKGRHEYSMAGGGKTSTASFLATQDAPGSCVSTGIPRVSVMGGVVSNGHGARGVAGVTLRTTLTCTIPVASPADAMATATATANVTVTITDTFVPAPRSVEIKTRIDTSAYDAASQLRHATSKLSAATTVGVQLFWRPGTISACP